MIRLLLFFKKIYVALLFIGLEILCLSLFLNSNPYQRAQMLSVSNHVVSGMHGKISDVGDYFQLSQQNEALMAENAILRNELLNYKMQDTISGTIAYHLSDTAQVIVVKALRSTISARDNYITISAGKRQGIEPDMALFNMHGIVGYVLHCSDNYSVAMSVLNYSGFHTSGKIKNSEFTASVSWDGKDYRVIDFYELPEYAAISIGDTILTTSNSNIFPADIPIGIVLSFDKDNGMFYRGRLRLLADMSALNYLYAVKLPAHDERAQVEATVLNKKTE